MKKVLSVLLLCLLVISLGACSSSESNKDRLESIKEKGKIVIGTNSGYPPYEFYDVRNGKKDLVGYDVDLGNEIAKKLGVKAEFVDMEFDALIPNMLSGKIDIILAGLVNTEERRKSVDFTDDYFESHTVMVAKKDKLNDLLTTDKLNQKSVVVQVATTQGEIGKGISGLEVVELPTVGDMIASLISGKVDGMLIAGVSAKNIVEKYPEYDYKMIEDIPKDKLVVNASVALEKNQDKLCNKLNEIINELKENKKLEEMFNKNVELYNKISVE